MASPSLQPERWRRISEIAADALDLSGAERAAMLDSACAGDADLRAEVDALLAVDAVAGEAIGGAVDRSVAALEENESRIGPYEIERELGRGGMGAVYLARRSDGEFTQQVAIKLVKRGLDSDFILARFRQERQILARLAHPNIARLLDGGSTASGQPYFVMEYVDGRPIAEYCRDRLEATEVLRLFLLICDAVAYAHRNLVVHRDLKPGNILVTGEGVPKLLDFGISKLADPEFSETAPETSTGLRLLTPDYASPEQVRGEPVDTRSDVYSLGAVLYELLTGVRPHRLERYTPAEVERAVCETEILAPSAASRQQGDPAAARRLTGDLDNIVLMALRKDPARRYSSVEQFAADIHRYLDGQPVEARRPTLRYRARKFVRRNRLAVTAAALVFASTAAGLGVALYQARRAERRFGQVRKLANTFLFDFHDSIENLPGSMKARELVVRTAGEYLDSLAREASGDLSLQSELALAYLKVGDLQGDPRRPNLGQTAAAYDTYRKGMDLAEASLARDPGNLTVTRAAVQIANKLSDVSYRLHGSVPAIASCRRGLAASDRIVGSPQASDPDWEARRSLLNILGDMLVDAGQVKQAVDAYREALETVDRNTPGPRTDGARVVCLTRMGSALGKSGQLASGIEHLERARVLQEALAAAEPANVRHRRILSGIYQRLGDLAGGPDWVNAGDTARSLELYRKAIPLGEAMLEADSKNTQALNGLSFSYEGLGAVLLESDPAASAAAFARTLEMRRTLHAGAPRDLDHQQTLAAAAAGLAAAKLRLNQPAEAETLYREALGRLEEICAADPGRRTFQLDRLLARLGLARLLATRRRWAESLDLLQQAGREAERINQPAPAAPLERRALPFVQAGLASHLESRAADPDTDSAARRAFLQQALSARRKEQALWDDWLGEGIAVEYAKPRRESSAQAAAKLAARIGAATP